MEVLRAAAAATRCRRASIMVRTKVSAIDDMLPRPPRGTGECQGAAVTKGAIIVAINMTTRKVSVNIRMQIDKDIIRGPSIFFLKERKEQ